MALKIFERASTRSKPSGKLVLFFSGCWATINMRNESCFDCRGENAVAVGVGARAATIGLPTVLVGGAGGGGRAAESDGSEAWRFDAMQCGECPSLFRWSLLRPLPRCVSGV